MKRRIALPAVLALVTALVAGGLGARPADATGAPVVSIGQVTVNEGDLPTTTTTAVVDVPITLSQTQAVDVVVTWAVTGGSASSGVDYRAVNGSRTTRIRAGRTRGFASIRPFADAAVETDETVTVTVTNATVVGIGAAAGGVTIVDDDAFPDPSLRMGAVSAIEGDSPLAAAVQVPIRLSEPLAGDVVVRWDVRAPGTTATPSVDYRAINKPQNTRIRAGRTSAIATITLFGDLAGESDETIELRILNVTHPGTLDVATLPGGVTIIDDDSPAPPPSNAYTWGWNAVGQLGNGTTTDNPTPATVGSGTWSSMSAGAGHTCGLRVDGTAWCWGDNFWGQLGDGTTTRTTTPGQVGTDTDWASIRAGGGHTCGLRFDGSLWCWGRNDFGAVGDGTTTNRLTPTQVGTDTDWVEVVANYGETPCALKTNRTLWCWGYNNTGQVGDGTTTDRTAPTQVGTATNWVDVSSGLFHTCGVRGLPGTMWCWGYNGFGQLGDGTTTAHTTPAQVGSATNWTDASAGSYQSCGLQSPGALWCWGRNFEGEVGDGTTTDRPNPTQVGSATDWHTVAAGGAYGCALRQTGTLWCWGWNAFGQLGDGTTTNRLTPTQVGSASNWGTVSTNLHTAALTL